VSCALDVAAAYEGGLTLEAVAALAGLTRQRIQQIEAAALGKMRKRLATYR